MSDQVKKVNKTEFKSYPFLAPLLNIEKCPEFFYYKGEIPQKSNGVKVVSIIGSRKMTSYGKDVIFKLLSEIQGENIIIISGLALGCDSEAHRLAIKNNLLTVAFPGSGVEDEVLYPQVNIKLAREILNTKGAIMSEFDPKQKSALWTFPARNRILAALSDMVIIIEAEEKSGTQITARLALEYGKDLAIVPGSIFSLYSRGTVGLWKDGAYPITCGRDILEILKIGTSNSLLDQIDRQDSKFGESDDSLKTLDSKNPDLNKSGLSSTEKIILSFLEAPIYKDELLDNCISQGLAFDQVITTLITLEARGIIRDHFDEIKRIK